MGRIIRRQELPFDMIIGADLHIREDVPESRTDNYLAAQFKKMSFIKDLCDKHNCPFVVAGDIFDYWKPSPFLLSRSLELLPRQLITVAGNHDLPNHSLQELPRSGLNTLVQAGRATLLKGGRSQELAHPGMIFGYSYGEKVKNPPKDDQGRPNILLWHRLTYEVRQPWQDPSEVVATGLLFKQFPNFDLIVTGDNHRQFVLECEGRYLLNPGSMMRMTADQIQFQPAVFGWRSAGNSLTRIPLPIEQDVISTAHLGKEKKETRDVRLEAYIVRARKQYESKLSFVANMEQHLTTSKTSEAVSKLIWKAIEKENA